MAEILCMRASSPQMVTCYGNSLLGSTLTWTSMVGDQQDMYLSPTHFFHQPGFPWACPGCREGVGLIYGLGNLPGGREGASDPGVNHGLPKGPSVPQERSPGHLLSQCFP